MSVHGFQKLLAKNHDNTRKALLVDTNRGSYPLFDALRSLGWHVSVVGTSGSGPLTNLCPNFICANYSDPYELNKVVEDKSFDAIIPGCTDASYIACSELGYNKKYGFDSLESRGQVFDKEKLRQLAARLDIQQPALLSEIDARSVEAIIIKPVDSFSGGGMARLSRPTKTRLRDAIDKAKMFSPSHRVIIEEFVVGQLYSHSAFLCNQTIQVDFFVQEDCIDNMFAVDTSCIALNISNNVQTQIRRSVERLAKELCLQDGLIHTQFIVRDGQSYLLEITRCHPGDLYGLLIQYSTGFDYAVHYLNAFLPNPLKPRQFPVKPRLIIRHTITSSLGLDLWSLQFHAPLKIREWVPLATAGNKLSPAPKGRVAIMFLEASNEEMQLELYNSLKNREVYSIVDSK